ncbi:TaqI-like C-terminal specificity domain-containing protein [Ferruginibacter sp.]|uniref:type IIG restriction enzyme/methyltransferase n=1 Tax=Ferruginibacter sp. TaxID=1940288 RepID=UPI002658DDB8|nr:TaqI-like C-terminal specificity domain-containing protein [Ferruginibacter sp.]
MIHTGKTTKEPVGVILEVKKPSNKSEMMAEAKPNSKALQELILYYLRERFDHSNTDIKYLVVTNIYEWFIIDEVWFEKNVFRNSKLKKDYENWKLSGKDTKFFYDSIAKAFLDEVTEEMPAAYFDVRDYQKYVANIDKADDTKLIGLYKILSPAHLLKQPFINDSNSLDTKFYTELLHIIGLEEVKDGSKKLIKRKAKSDEASLLENTIIKLEDKDALRNISNLLTFGANKEEQLFNVALELCITWVNRVLFIKLLEAQLYKYHKGNKDYLFLNSKLVFDFDELSNLFFQVLAEKPGSRRNHIQEKFSKVPYLNSSLFERIELERQTINISELDNRLQLPLSGSTVLKDDKGKRKTGSLPTLQYLFEFLDAYDFTSEGGEEIQEENKNLINASVLGLIFEKINGYKDGSFFTPGFVTMYMCKETIRRSVLQKFNDTKGWQCDTMDSLYNKIDDKKEANKIINSLHICDPAVGSGHFLVSALNEMIAVKSELKILQDAAGKSLRDYHVEVVNDELIITDEDGKLFDYNPQNKESQRIQETLFHEKETIIENCLFGVDINPNSVKICRLRLWIELLKNAYYTPSSNYAELETLPNIDINIKCGNSLISRFALDADIKSALRNSKWSIDSYKVAVQTYRDAESKEQKREMEELIDSIKKDFRSYISPNDPKYKKLSKLRGDLFNISQTKELFDEGNKRNKDTKKKIEQLSNEITKLETEIGEIKNNKIYENAFEWRFEFPEVLNGDGDYIGFDMMIGNPPYGVNFNKSSGVPYEKEYETFNWRGESYTLFIERAVCLLKNHGNFGYIIPDTLINLGFTESIRTFILKNSIVSELVLLPSNVFNDATVDTILLFFQKNISELPYNKSNVQVNLFEKKSSISDLKIPKRSFGISSELWYHRKNFNLQSNIYELSIIQRLDVTFPKLAEFAGMFSGIKTYEVGKGKPIQTEEIRAKKPFTSIQKIDNNWLPFFDGKDIGHYSLLWKENNWLKYGPWLAAPRLPENFENEKILIRKITGKTLIAHYIPNTSYCNTLLFVLKLQTGKALLSYKALLGILNSEFIGWYFRKKFQISNDDTFPQIMIRDILQFAIPNVSNSITASIEEKVSKIIDLKKTAPIHNTTNLENEINSLVYEFYCLTEDEIKIIEQK